MSVRLYTVWAVDRGADEYPWMLLAWDEYTIEGNPDGWDDAVATEKAKCAADAEFREVTVTLDYEQVRSAFDPTAVPGEVRP